MCANRARCGAAWGRGSELCHGGEKSRPAPQYRQQDPPKPSGSEGSGKSWLVEEPQHQSSQAEGSQLGFPSMDPTDLSPAWALPLGTLEPSWLSQSCWVLTEDPEGIKGLLECP